jgi:hypothetical protein
MKELSSMEAGRSSKGVTAAHAGEAGKGWRKALCTVARGLVSLSWLQENLLQCETAFHRSALSSAESIGLL